LSHQNDWFAREARRILGERRDPAVLPRLREIVKNHKDQLALEALWALYLSGKFDDALAAALFSHANEDVRAWTVRLLGDAKHVSATIRQQLARLAQTESSCVVRSQLACTCKRLPAGDALPIIRELLERREDVTDPQIPLLLWWALEDKAGSHRQEVLSLLKPKSAWQNPIFSQFLVERLGRRYMAAGTAADLEACAQLLGLAPSPGHAELVVRGMDKALEGRRVQHVPAALERSLAELWQKQTPSLALTRLGLRIGLEVAYERASKVVGNRNASVEVRVNLTEALGQIGRAECVPALLPLLNQTEPTPVRLAGLAALQPYADPKIADTVLTLYARMPAELRSRAQSMLFGRLDTTREFLKAVNSGRINPKEVALDQVRRMLLHHDEEINRLVEKHWGKIGAEAPGEKRARIASVKHMLGTGPGDVAHGKPLFEKKCAICHTLFGQGNRVGPDLTGGDRRDLDFLVTSVVDPSAVIRTEYAAYVLFTKSGRLLTGLMAESNPKTVTLLDAKNERTVIDREDIQELKTSPESLMPEKILDDLDEQQIRDLFSYLQAPGPLAGNQVANSIAPAAEGKKSPLKVCLVSGSIEYNSDESLGKFQKYLEDHYNAECTRAFRKSDNDLPGLDQLDDCDVMLLFTRRLTISGDQLARIKRYCEAGKPVVAVRTASHAFQTWLGLDREVLGGDYQGHYGAGPAVEIHASQDGQRHPILNGVSLIKSVGSLYKNPQIARGTEILLTGNIPGHSEPIAWTRVHAGGRVFYTSLGHPEDFADDNFKRMLANALFWCANRPVTKR
jgi:putative heme-binding domain-containing protein